MDVERTPDSRFADLDWSFAPHYLTHPDGLRQHYVDERPEGPARGTFLLLHGEPTWSYLYKDWIGPLVDLGYRVVAPDHLGFGRSDKPVDDGWYSIAGHRRALETLITDLDLHDISLVVQDWAGPIGLCTALTDPDRYARLFILNTWLHHDAYEYGEGIRWWHEAALDPERFGADMPTGAIVAGTMRRPDVDAESVRKAFDAPFTGAASKAGARRFPVCLPFAEPALGDAALQQRARARLREWAIPIHLAFGDADPVFPYETAEAWAAELPGATLDRIPGAGHFVQLDAPADCLAIVREHLGQSDG
ncbi:MAG TPA: alpha/beta fold hydrolase [Acidimicrobiales bacterium]